MEGFILEVNGWEIWKVEKFSFSLSDPDLGYWYIIWNVNTKKKKGWNLKNTFSALYVFGLEILYIAWFLFSNILNGDLFFNVLIIGFF